MPRIEIPVIVPVIAAELPVFGNGVFVGVMAVFVGVGVTVGLGIAVGVAAAVGTGVVVGIAVGIIVAIGETDGAIK